jgi:hypothetical protein
MVDRADLMLDTGTEPSPRQPRPALHGSVVLLDDVIEVSALSQAATNRVTKIRRTYHMTMSTRIMSPLDCAAGFRDGILC